MYTLSINEQVTRTWTVNKNCVILYNKKQNFDYFSPKQLHVKVQIKTLELSIHPALQTFSLPAFLLRDIGKLVPPAI